MEEARDKAIALAEYEWETEENGKVSAGTGEITHFQPGEILKDTESGRELEILLQTKVRPNHMERRAPNRIVLIVSDEWMNEYPATGGKYDNVEVYVKCEDADKIEAAIRNDIQLQHFTVTNYDAQVRSERSMNLLIAIFLYGFLAVVVLIGVTNIFNTITTNMELRAPEFATLQSVGMTGREFRRMIWLESVFYGGKALLIGLPLGLVLSAWFYRAFNARFDRRFQVPWTGMAVATLAVAALLYLIMHYSMGKINRRNIIDTIRNENI